MKFDDPTFCDGAEFRDIETLSEAEQRELLGSSDPRVRVWAAWALGVRLSSGISPEVRGAIASEPEAGVRRHLLVMLAGFGEVDIVAALARHDPDAYVRKTAARFVGELSVNHPDAFAIAEQLLCGERPEIRAALIDGLPAVVPDRLQTLLAEARRDESSAVREAMARRDAAAGDTEELRRVATSDPDSVVRRQALRRLVEDSGVYALLDPMPAHARPNALADLRAVGARFRYFEVADLNPGPAYLPLLELDDLGAPGRIWLLGLLGAAVRDYWQIVSRAYQSVHAVDHDEQIAVTEFVAAVEDSLLSGVLAANDIAEGALTEWGNWSPWEAARRELLEQLSVHVVPRG